MRKILKALPWYIAAFGLYGLIGYAFMSSAMSEGSFEFIFVGGLWLLGLVLIIGFHPNVKRVEDIIYPILLIGIPLLLLVGDFFFDDFVSLRDNLDTVAGFILFFLAPVFLLMGLWVILKRTEKGYKEDLKWTEARLKRVEGYEHPNHPYRKRIDEECQGLTDTVISGKAWLRRFKVYKFCFYLLLLFVYFWALLRILAD